MYNVFEDKFKLGGVNVNYFEECIKRISESVKYDSSQYPAKEGKPFGDGAADCLNHFLALAQS